SDRVSEPEASCPHHSLRRGATMPPWILLSLAVILRDLIAWERFTLPTWRAEAATQAFAWDWPAYEAAGASPTGATTTVRRTPPAWVGAETFAAFVDHALAASWSRAQRMDLALVATRAVAADTAS